jgi:acyl-CoA synthetase (AMP-forming)/AMP-acid ligase II
MQQNSRSTLRAALVTAGALSHRFIADEMTRLPLATLVPTSPSLDGNSDDVFDRSVFLAADTQLACATALVGLDGVARRILLAPPDLLPRHLASVLAAGEVETIVCDTMLPGYQGRRIVQPGAIPLPAGPAAGSRAGGQPTEWVLFTSGTTGPPKMAVHSLDSLSGHLPAGPPQVKPLVWCTFYDIRRYGGLQVLLRALLGGGSMILSGNREPLGAFLSRAGVLGVTHILGTPSHWRRVLMTGEPNRIVPHYVRLSGEVADQAILDRLKAVYPESMVAHAFASTEAGVAFAFVGPGDSAELRVVDGSLRIRSRRVATSYLGRASGSLADADGFVDTGDIVELRDGRYYFVGRREGIINMGGLKVHPEEVEAVINRHPAVEISLVKAQRNPITGAVPVADVVMKRQAARLQDEESGLVEEIRRFCHEELPAHKVPAMIRIVTALEIAPSGKLIRSRA